MIGNCKVALVGDVTSSGRDEAASSSPTLSDVLEGRVVHLSDDGVVTLEFDDDEEESEEPGLRLANDTIKVGYFTYVICTEKKKIKKR